MRFWPTTSDLANDFGLKTSCCAITAILAYVKYASTRHFACAPFLAPKSLRQIGNPWFSGTNSGGVYEPLMLEVRFLSGADNGDSRVCQIRFDPPFRLRPVFSSKIIAPNREPLVFRNELRRRIRTSHGRFVFCRERITAIDSLFSPLRGKMPTHFILPESLIL